MRKCDGLDAFLGTRWAPRRVYSKSFGERKDVKVILSKIHSSLPKHFGSGLIRSNFVTHPEAEIQKPIVGGVPYQRLGYIK